MFGRKLDLKMKFDAKNLLVGLLLGYSLSWSYTDYKSWIDLGEGGLPHHLGGWLTTSFYRLIGGDPLSQKGFLSDIGEPWDVKVLSSLSGREGERPRIAPQPVPHRQLSQINEQGLRDVMIQSVEEFAAKYPDTLEYAISHTELHNQALWVADVNDYNAHSNNNGEIAHVHVGDGSVHVILSPSDAKVVMDSGWGELHPLSSAGLMSSNTYMMIYAPRDISEIEVVKKIVRAGAVFALGVGANSVLL